MTTDPTTTDPTYDRGQRPAREGEVCTCGRAASVVIWTDRFGEVGWCGSYDGGAGPAELAVIQEGLAQDTEASDQPELRELAAIIRRSPLDQVRQLLDDATS